jgi:hypothetical protein
MTTRPTQGERIQELQELLHQKNRELDALGRVWCDGGCGSGMFRWAEREPLTEDELRFVERNTRRMRTWHQNAKFRAAWQTRHRIRSRIYMACVARYGMVGRLRLLFRGAI